MNTNEIVQRIAEGDFDACDWFVRTHYTSVLRLCLRLVRSQEDAEDLAQQTFVKARVNILAFRQSASLKTWVLRIAVNECRQFSRKRRFKALVSLHSDISAPQADFDGRLDLERALAKIGERHREAFVLHEVEELSVSEVADALHVPVGTVKARLFYARRKIRAILEDDPKEILDTNVKSNLER